MSEPLWNRVTVVGCGLIGASFALAVRRAGATARVAGWDISSETLSEALARGVIDEVDDAFDAGAVSTSDLVYLATPVGEIIRFLRERGRQVRPGALVTDAGSTKREVCRAARECLPKDRVFVGGHPVAGSHAGGLAHAHANLFACAPYVLTLDEDDADRSRNEDFARSVAALEETLGLVGARVVHRSPEEHDRALALVSHLPQLVSSSLACVVEAEGEGVASLAGSGFRDMTRLAASPWLIWGDILSSNRDSVADALDALVARLSAVSEELRAGASLSASRALFKEAANT